MAIVFEEKSMTGEIVRGAVRFYGVYRSDKYGTVNAADAALMHGIIRNGFRKTFNGRGPTLGYLRNLVGRLYTDDEHWQIALERLVNYRLIVIDLAGGRSDSVMVVLTDMGRDFAIEVIGQRQLERQPADGE
jgi:hypothetical protein